MANREHLYPFKYLSEVFRKVTRDCASNDPQEVLSLKAKLFSCCEELAMLACIRTLV